MNLNNIFKGHFISPLMSEAKPSILAVRLGKTGEINDVIQTTEPLHQFTPAGYNAVSLEDQEVKEFLRGKQPRPVTCAGDILFQRVALEVYDCYGKREMTVPVDPRKTKLRLEY